MAFSWPSLKLTCNRQSKSIKEPSWLVSLNDSLLANPCPLITLQPPTITKRVTPHPRPPPETPSLAPFNHIVKSHWKSENIISIINSTYTVWTLSILPTIAQGETRWVVPTRSSLTNRLSPWHRLQKMPNLKSSRDWHLKTSSHLGLTCISLPFVISTSFRYLIIPLCIRHYYTLEQPSISSMKMSFDA